MESAATNSHDAGARFAALLERHRGILHKVAATYCWNAEDRADLMQEMSVELWRAFARYDTARPFATWMYRVALNVALSHVRSDSLRQRTLVPLEQELHEEIGAEVDQEGAQHLRLLYGVIAELDAMNRALLLLYLDDCNQRDIADILGISETNVATKIGRLKQRIRAHFGH